VRSRVQFLAHLPYARLACLFLAAAQLMPLPEEPEDCPSRSLGVVRAGPDPWSERPPLEGGILNAARSKAASPNRPGLPVVHV
jgi:hypothetical protein